MESLAMYVLLQIYPPEASDDDDDPPLDVIAVNPSEAELKGYLVAYEYRYRAACEALGMIYRRTGATSMIACSTSSRTNIRSTAA
jgi:hypothetical protein